jgi:hypothetical protein
MNLDYSQKYISYVTHFTTFNYRNTNVEKELNQIWNEHIANNVYFDVGKEYLAKHSHLSLKELLLEFEQDTHGNTDLLIRVIPYIFFLLYQKYMNGEEKKLIKKFCNKFSSESS